MKAKLISLDPQAPIREIVLEKLPAVIGRGSDVDIHLHDRWLSRHHCKIECVSATLMVRDLKSRNGTLVNRRQITEKVLMPGDQLTIGSHTFVVCYEHRPAAFIPGSDRFPANIADSDDDMSTMGYSPQANT